MFQESGIHVETDYTSRRADSLAQRPGNPAWSAPNIEARPTLPHTDQVQHSIRIQLQSGTLDGQALYFSKNVIPFIPPEHEGKGDLVHLHLGLYAYRREALTTYAAAPVSVLESLEGLEQLRFLDMGIGIGAVVCEPPEGLTIELNNPGDRALIEDELQRRGQ